MVRMLTIADAGSRKIQGLGMDFSDFIYIYVRETFLYNVLLWVC